MSGFEYVSVLASIVIGLGLADILTSFHRLVRNHRLVKWDWAVLAATVYTILTIVWIWWSLFRPGQEQFSVGAFVFQLVELVLLFLLASAALPDEVPAGGLDLRRYYDQNGPYFWSLYSAALGYPLLAEIAGIFLQGGTLKTVLRHGDDLALLAVFISLIFVRNRWWHLLAFVAMASGPVRWMSHGLPS